MPELGTISDKQAAALAGIAPINNDSGRTDGRRSLKDGRYNIRCLLYQAALVASTHNKPLKEFAQRLKEKGKPHKVILIALAQKLLVIANGLDRLRLHRMDPVAHVMEQTSTSPLSHF